MGVRAAAGSKRRRKNVDVAPARQFVLKDETAVVEGRTSSRKRDGALHAHAVNQQQPSRRFRFSVGLCAYSTQTPETGFVRRARRDCDSANPEQRRFPRRRLQARSIGSRSFGLPTAVGVHYSHACTFSQKLRTPTPCGTDRPRARTCSVVAGTSYLPCCGSRERPPRARTLDVSASTLSDPPATAKVSDSSLDGGSVARGGSLLLERCLRSFEQRKRSRAKRR